MLDKVGDISADTGKKDSCQNSESKERVRNQGLSDESIDWKKGRKAIKVCESEMKVTSMCSVDDYLVVGFSHASYRADRVDRTCCTGFYNYGFLNRR